MRVVDGAVALFDAMQGVEVWFFRVSLNNKYRRKVRQCGCRPISSEYQDLDLSINSIDKDQVYKLLWKVSKGG